MADQLMQEVAPLLSAEGIDLNDPNTFDVETLNAALARAVERRNFELFVATGERLSYARTILRVFTEAVGNGERDLAEGVIWSIEPEPADAASASVAHVIGVSTELADTWFGDPYLAGNLAKAVVPAWGGRGRAAAADILALARKGRAFDSIGALHRRHSGLAIIEGGALVIAGTLIALSKEQNRDLREVAAEMLASDD
jgi:hypothetical protein